MDINQYSPLALRTLNPTYNHQHLDATHAILGMMTECPELIEARTRELIEARTREQIKDEAGDFLWYFNLLLATRQVQWSDVLEPARVLTRSNDGVSSFTALLFSVAILADHEKKALVYGKPINASAYLGVLIATLNYLLRILDDYGLPLEDVLEANIVKLEKRYPNLRFQAEYAINPDKQAEAEAQRGSTGTQI